MLGRILQRGRADAATGEATNEAKAEDAQYSQTPQSDPADADVSVGARKRDDDTPPLPVYWPADPAGRARTRRAPTFDALLAPLVIATIAGRGTRRAPVESEEERLAASFTIDARFTGGVVHVWGAGVAGDRGSRDRRPNGFKMPSSAKWAVYATRGPFSAAMLRAVGVEAPEIYGDPLWFAPRILPFNEPKTVEVGVLPPSGFRQLAAVQRASMRRFEIPADVADDVELIDFSCAPTLSAMTELARRLGRCKRLIVSEPSQLALAVALGVPTALFTRGGGGLMHPRIDDDLVSIPATARDLMAGYGAERLLVCRQPTGEPTKWEQVATMMDANWERPPYNPSRFFSAFPTEPAVDPFDPQWAIPDGVGAYGEKNASRGVSPLQIAARIASRIGGGGARPTTAAQEATTPVADQADAQR